MEIAKLNTTRGFVRILKNNTEIFSGYNNLVINYKEFIAKLLSEHSINGLNLYYNLNQRTGYRLTSYSINSNKITFKFEINDNRIVGVINRIELMTDEGDIFAYKDNLSIYKDETFSLVIKWTITIN